MDFQPNILFPESVSVLKREGAPMTKYKFYFIKFKKSLQWLIGARPLSALHNSCYSIKWIIDFVKEYNKHSLIQTITTNDSFIRTLIDSYSLTFRYFITYYLRKFSFFKFSFSNHYSFLENLSFLGTYFEGFYIFLLM